MHVSGSVGGHLALGALMPALEIYRAHFKPNGQPPALAKPHAMVAVNVATDEEASYVFTSLQQRFPECEGLVSYIDSIP